MGSCLQSFFRSNRSSLRTETLLNHQQLSTLLQASTRNDHVFYSSSNLQSVEKFLTTLTLKPNSSIDHQFVMQNIGILNKFVLDLKDRTSITGQLIVSEQHTIQQYIQRQLKNSQNKDIKYIKQSTVSLKLEVQVLLLGGAAMQQLELDNGELIIEIQQSRANVNKLKKQLQQSTNNNQQSTIQESHQFNINTINRSKGQNIDYIYVNMPSKQIEHIQFATKSQAKVKKQGYQNKNSLQANRQSQLQEFKLFTISSKVVDINSMINIRLVKTKKKKNSNLKQANHMSQSRSTKIIGQTSLSVSDFLYYNYLVVSDVVPLMPSSTIKSSVATSATNSNAVGFISLRGQALKALTLQKDYIKIIKQHQSIIQQLQLCLQGQKGWEKLSEFRNSSGSHKGGQSIYSDYSMPRQSARVYKI